MGLAGVSLRDGHAWIEGRVPVAADVRGCLQGQGIAIVRRPAAGHAQPGARRSKIGNKDETREAEDHGSQDGRPAAGRDRAGAGRSHRQRHWYAIHLNKTYKAFVDDYGLRDRKVLDHLPTDLSFRTGSVELKSAWRIIEGPAPQNLHHDESGRARLQDGRGGHRRARWRSDTGRHRRVARPACRRDDRGPSRIHLVDVRTREPCDQALGQDVAPAATVNPGKTPVLVQANASAYTLYPNDPKAPPAPRVPMPTAAAASTI